MSVWAVVRDVRDQHRAAELAVNEREGVGHVRGQNDVVDRSERDRDSESDVTHVSQDSACGGRSARGMAPGAERH